MVWLAVHFPGNIDSDTITQRLQWQGLQKRSDHHPWFDTMVFGWFWDFGRAIGNDALGLFSYLIVQVVALAAGVGLALCYLTTLGLGRRAQAVLALITAFWPIFLMVTPQMSKDSFAAIFWLPFLVLFTEGLRTRGRSLVRPLAGGSMVLASLLLVLSKRTNLYLIVLCLLVLLCTVAVRRVLPLIAGFAVVAGLSQGLWAGVILPANHIAKPTSTDMFTLPIQQTARIAATHGNQIPPREREVIDKVLRWNGLGKAYVPRRSDSAKGRWNTDASAAEKSAYFGVWFDQLLRYPGTAASATAANTFEYFAPVTRFDVVNENKFTRYIDFWTARSYPTTGKARIQAMADRLDEPDALDGPRHRLNDVVTQVSQVPILGSKAFYASWLPLLLLVAALRRRNWFQVACCTPFLVNLAFLFAGPVALPRYLTSAVIVSTFIVGLGMTNARWEPRRLVDEPAIKPTSEPAAAAQ
nr:DUF6020 family protein [Flexivirga meconopsidis]